MYPGENETFLRTDTFDLDQPTPVSEYFVLEKLITVHGRTVFICAGTSSSGTAASLDRLTDWRKLEARFGPGGFGLLYEQRLAGPEGGETEPRADRIRELFSYPAEPGAAGSAAANARVTAASIRGISSGAASTKSARSASAPPVSVLVTDPHAEKVRMRSLVLGQHFERAPIRDVVADVPGAAERGYLVLDDHALSRATAGDFGHHPAALYGESQPLGLPARPGLDLLPAVRRQP
jgi:hypothetical protein